MRRACLAGAALAALAALPACSRSADGPPPKDETVRGTLSVEVRHSVEVTVAPSGLVSLTFGEGDLGVLAGNAKLTAAGSIEALPEAGATMYTALLPVPKREGGPCGDRPMTLALSLVRRGRNARVGGGLAAYCGPDARGVPARVLRLSGDLPLP